MLQVAFHKTAVHRLLVINTPVFPVAVACYRKDIFSDLLYCFLPAYVTSVMLDLNKMLESARIAHDRELLERQIKITDDQIDRLVYELYGLTEEEIRIVES